MYKVIIGVVIAAAVLIIGFMMIDPKVNNNQTTNTQQTVDSGSAYTIEGEVNKRFCIPGCRRRGPDF